MQKNCQVAIMQKIAKKIAIFLKIAKNRGRDFPEGQIGNDKSPRDLNRKWFQKYPCLSFDTTTCTTSFSVHYLRTKFVHF